MIENELTVYELVGGEATFRRLVDTFYAKVEADEILRAVFPEDLESGKEWQYLFLMQYWGGPSQYAEVRGHPRLRMRHFPFAITVDSRNRWVRYMNEAIDEVGIRDPARSMMREYFERAGTAMINRHTPSEE
jgi:hemoglobin